MVNSNGIHGSLWTDTHNVQWVANNAWPLVTEWVRGLERLCRDCQLIDVQGLTTTQIDDWIIIFRSQIPVPRDQRMS